MLFHIYPEIMLMGRQISFSELWNFSVPDVGRDGGRKMEGDDIGDVGGNDR